MLILRQVIMCYPLLFVLLPLVVANKSIEYLALYGYIADNAKTEDIGSAATLFQEVYHLEPTGVLDNETLNLLAWPRCGNIDTIQPFTADRNRKWNSSVLTWLMYGEQKYNWIIQRAFDVWAKHTNLAFRRSYGDPTLILSFSGQRKHFNYAKNTNCSYDFDGPGYVIAHAYYRENSCNRSDIHFDSDENWDFTMSLPAPGKISFYLTAVHEIGHSLGLAHSYDNASIMFPYSNVPKGIANLYEFDLSTDDKNAIQYMYGFPTPTVPPTSPPTVPPTSPPTVHPTSPPRAKPTTTEITTQTDAPLSGVDICSLKNDIHTYLVVNKKIFAFYKHYVWVINLEASRRTKEEYTKPLKITDWLTFLPENFKEVTAIYQNPVGDIVLIVGTDIYMFKFPELTLLRRYSISSIIRKNVQEINAVVSSNRGRTFIFTDDSFVFEINECSLTSSILGNPSTVFNGIPENVIGAFRYINGMLYFFTDSSVLEYNEFTSTVVRAVPDIFGVLQIVCMRETLISRLLEVIGYLQ